MVAIAAIIAASDGAAAHDEFNLQKNGSREFAEAAGAEGVEGREARTEGTIRWEVMIRK